MRRSFLNQICILVGAACSFVFFSGFTGGCGAPEDRCRANSDCAKTHYCDFSDRGVPYPLQGDEARPAIGTMDGSRGSLPASGVCKRRKRAHQKCYSNSDCGKGEYCKYGASPRPLPGDDPASGSADLPYRKCGNQVPRPAGVCVKRTQPNRCTKNSDCRSGQICQKVTHRKASSSSSTQATSKGEDVPTDREPQEDRAPTQRMPVAPYPTYGICVTAPQPPARPCGSKNDCGLGQICQSQGASSPGSDGAQPEGDRENSEPRAKCKIRSQGQTTSKCAPVAPPTKPQGFCRPQPKRCQSTSQCGKGFYCKQSSSGSSKPSSPEKCTSEDGLGCGSVSKRAPMPPPSSGVCTRVASKPGSSDVPPPKTSTQTTP